MKKSLFFRFNCGNMWGLGHLYRNLSLIEEMKNRGYECIVITNHNDVSKKVLEESNIKYIVTEEYETAEQIITILNHETNFEGDKVLFWDRLNSEQKYIDQLVLAGVKVVVYDDYDKSAFSAEMCINTRMIPIDGEMPVHCGSRYQLLRKDIQEYASKKKLIKKDANHILLHFGGTDPTQILRKSFEVLEGLEGFTLEYIAGKDEDPELRVKIESYCNSMFDQGVDDFGRRLFEADICVVAGGVTMYEAAAIGTPMINLCHNSDQEFAASIFNNKVGSINLGIASPDNLKLLKQCIIDLASDYKRRKEMSSMMKDFVPANGISAVCNLIDTVITRE